jgi:hypothetical protein
MSVLGFRVQSLEISVFRFQCSGVRAMETYQKLFSVICHLFSDTRHLKPRYIVEIWCLEFYFLGFWDLRGVIWALKSPGY